MLVAITFVTALLSAWGWSSYKHHVELLKKIEHATANPTGLNPGALIGQIDDSFSKLPNAEKHRILSDPKLLSARIEQASYNNYKEAFSGLFALPRPIREELIRNSAEAINSSIERNPAKVNSFYESDAGKAALRAASRYFLLDLNGKQKNELKPLSSAFFKIHKQRANQKK